MKWVWNKADDFWDFVNVIVNEKIRQVCMASKPLSSSGTSTF